MAAEARKRPPAPGQKKFLWDYSGETTEQLILLESDYRIDSILIVFEQALSRKKETRKLSTAEADILAIEAMEREVNNGGFHQFFSNSSGDYAPALPSALERIGCPITAKIASDALAYLQIQGEPTPAKVRDALRRMGTKSINDLAAIEKPFFAYQERIADTLFAYVKAHKSEIQLP